MNEKVTHEIRLIETEDGFRIELKGDKEELRQLIFGGGWAGIRRFFRHPREGEHQPHEGRHHPHEGRKRHRYDLGMWWDNA